MDGKTYTKIYHKKFPIWNKKFRKKLSKEAKIVYLFLLTSPLTHHSGLFELSETFLINTGLKQSEIEKGVSELFQNGLITVDEELEYYLIPYLVENIKIDNPNMLKSLINHILDFSDSFILDEFGKLFDITEVFKRFDNGSKTVSEGLRNGYETVMKRFANIHNRLYNIDNTKKIIDNKENIKQETENIKDDKSSSFVISDKPKITKHSPQYYLQYLNIWNNFLDETGNPFKLKRTTEIGFKNMIDKIKKYEKKGLTPEIFADALKESIQYSFLFGDNDRGWKMDILFLMNPDKRANLYAGKYVGNKQMKRSGNEFNNVIKDFDDEVVGAPF